MGLEVSIPKGGEGDRVLWAFDVLGCGPKELAGRFGATRLLLEVRPSNVAARALYAQAGFLELSVRRYIERPEDLVKMLRRNKELVEDRLSRPEPLKKGLPRR